MNLFVPPPRANLIFVFRLAVLLLLPLVSYSQTFFGAASSLADPGSQTGTTATIIPPATMIAGDLVIIYAHYRGTSGSASISTTGDQAWSRETSPAGSNSQTFAIFWCRYNGTWSTNPIITGGTSSIALTAVMYVYRPTNSSNSWGIHIGPNNGTPSGTAINITGFNTTVPNTVTMAFWGSPDDNTWTLTPSTGWSKTGTGLSAQYRNTAGSDQSHTAAYNIRPIAGAVANVSQTSLQVKIPRQV